MAQLIYTWDKSPWYPLDSRLYGRADLDSMEKTKILFLPGFEP
jgi:hypothetical protein